MFDILKIRENEPISISLDLNLDDIKFYDANEIGLISLSKQFKEILLLNNDY